MTALAASRLVPVAPSRSLSVMVLVLCLGYLSAGRAVAAAIGPIVKKQTSADTGHLRPNGYYPLPPYPEAARQKRIRGSGQARVTFGSDGKVVTAVMAKPTGNDVLDENVTSYIKAHWQSPAGKPYSCDVVVHYALHPKDQPAYYTPDPPYASSEPVAGSARTVIVRVVFAKGGKVTDAKVLKTSGNVHVDQRMTAFIVSHWKSNLGVPEVKTAEVYMGRGVPLQ